jgi:CDP-glycerol glycerophosphotransferase (TagB/SpsB family)
VITGPLPVLYECFNQADLLISDISSVVSDFIASGKPYVVTNPEGLGEDEFREKFPTAGAGYLLGPDCAGLPGILAQAAAPGDDPLAEARRELRRYLLGPDKPDAQTRFADAIDALAERVARLTVSDPGSAPLAAPLAQTVGAPEA